MTNPAKANDSCPRTSVGHSRTRFAWLLVLLSFGWFGSVARSQEPELASGEFAIAPFSLDVTIPLGHRCMGVLPTKSLRVEHPLQAHGLVLWGGEQPVVFCAMDWCEIRNGAYDRLREAIAHAAGTTQDHVLLSALHQHDAPVVDTDAARLLAEVGLANELYDEDFFADVVSRVEQAVADACQRPQAITHVGVGRAQVIDIASNRRVVEADGSISFRRGSRSGSDVELAQADVGLIDPWLRTLSFWNGETPLAAIHSYATHPMSFYGQGSVTYDFVGMARERRRRDDFRVQQIYVSGCSGDVTAGKFNDGTHESREALADRLYHAMLKAWEQTEKFELSSMQLQSEAIAIPWSESEALTETRLLEQLRSEERTIEQRILAAMGLASFRRVAAGQRIDLVALHLHATDHDAPVASVVLFPGESFVGYQLLAQEKVGERFLLPIGYGESWTGYVPTSEAFDDGFEDFWLWVGRGSDAEIRRGLDQILAIGANDRRQLPNEQSQHRAGLEIDTESEAESIDSTVFVSSPRNDAEQSSQPTVDFQRDIRPLLSDTCWRCHGPDDQTREANLRLDTLEGATTGGDSGPAIVPGQPERSLMLQRVQAHGSERMPPEDVSEPWSAEAIERLTKWIEEGAIYEPHWSFRALRKPDLPLNDSVNLAEGPIDVWVREVSSRHGLVPAVEADRATLLRRLSFDLRGLPADREELARFQTDASPDAYERLVDRMLASPHFGERWGRHWLDQARYADSHGYTVDGERTMWPYRDWVMHAINSDMPFDQFTVEQLAGDLLEQPSVEQLVATGFHRNTLINQEGGSDAEQFRVEAVVDRVNTTGAVWLGLTVGCAQCHNHKYDPLTQAEYYQLYAFFNSGRDVNNDGATVTVPSLLQRQQLALIEERLSTATRLLEQFDRDHPGAARVVEASQSLALRTAESSWQVVADQQAQTQSRAELVRQGDGSWLATGEVAPQDEYRVRLQVAEPVTITAIRLQTLTDASLPQTGPGRASNGNFVLSEFELLDPLGGPRVIVDSLADHSQDNYPVVHSIDGNRATGWAINVKANSEVGPLNSDRTAWFALGSALSLEAGSAIELRLVFGNQPAGYSLGRFRISFSTIDPIELGFSDPERQQLVRSVESAKQEREALSRQIPRSLVMADLPEPRPSFVLLRGDFLRHGESVEPQTPAWLPEIPRNDGTSRATRLDLARWLVSSEQPLTPRVTVNRMWMQLYGKGLVETENDFGAQGSTPTHPQLLEFLAADLIDRQWSRKSLLREMVTSATYRQSSSTSSHQAARDPSNQWLARQSRVRVEGEIVRDLALAASGVLNRRIGGPSVHPPQSEGVYSFTQRVMSWPESQGADRYRRGMYTFFYRSAPYPLLTTFDAPKFETVCTRRVRSNTPLQSLTLANDPAFLELEGAWGWQVAQSSGADEQKLVAMFVDGLGREPSGSEQETLLRFAAQERTRFAEDSAARGQWLTAVGSSRWPTTSELANEVAVWSSVARVLFNLDEFITRE